MPVPEPIVVILAAGANTRFWPLREKSLWPFFDRPLLEHHLEALKAAGYRECVVVASPSNQAAVKRSAGAVAGITARVAVQRDPAGMGDGVRTAAASLDESDLDRPLLVTQAHDVVLPDAYRLLRQGLEAGADGVIVGQEVSAYFPGAYLEVERDLLLRIVEKPTPGSEPGNLVALVVHAHARPRALLEAIEAEYRAPATTDDHYERSLQRLLDGGMNYRVKRYAGPWRPIKYPWQVLEVMDFFLDELTADRLPWLESLRPDAEGVVMSADVRVFPGGLVAGPAYVGPGAVIGNGTLVRGSMIGRETTVGFSCEVARSYIGAHCLLHHDYVGDSVLSDGVGLGWGAVTGNWPFYAPPVKSTVSGARLRTGLEKLGAIIGEGVRTGTNVVIDPGFKIGAGSYVCPGVRITRDIPDGRLIDVKQRYVDLPNPFLRGR